MSSKAPPLGTPIGTHKEAWWGVSMAERKAVTKQVARRYRGATKTEKGTMLDELCALTGWTRRHARRALTGALAERAQPRRHPRPKIYGDDVLDALRFVWGCTGCAGG